MEGAPDEIVADADVRRVYLGESSAYKPLRTERFVNRIGFSQRLELRQSQALVMTPQLQQAIKMLQLSNLELDRFVDAEIEQNPLLERGERDPDERRRRPIAEPPADADGERRPRLAEPLGRRRRAALPATRPSIGRQPRATRATARSIAAAIPAVLGSSRDGRRSGGDDLPGLEQAAARPRTLREHLIEQIGADLPRSGRPRDRRSPARPARRGRLSARRARRRRRAARLPAGARRARARAAAAIRSARRLRPRSRRSAWRCSCATATGSTRRCRRCSTICRCSRRATPPALMRLCGVDAEDLAEMVAEIKSLDPRPGLAFDPPLAQPVVPDILMRPQPRRRLDRSSSTPTPCRACWSTTAITRGSAARRRSKAEREYLTERLQAANWLVKSLHQRATTILKVATEIVRQQDGFFPPRRAVAAAADPARHRRRDRHAREHGQPGHHQQIHRDAARPLRAEILLHLVDRRPRAAASAHSAEAVRFRIRGLIDGEPSRRTRCPTSASSSCCSRTASISPAAPSRNTAKRCGFRPRCSAAARRCWRCERRLRERRLDPVRGCPIWVQARQQ